MNQLLSSFAVVLASAALLTAVLNRNRDGGSRPTTAAVRADPVQTLGAQIEALQKDQGLLKESGRELLARVAQLERGNSLGGSGAAELARLRQRIDELDAKLTQAVQHTRDFDKYGVIAGVEKQLVKAYSTLLDTNQALAVRVKQAEVLKRHGQFDERAVNALQDLYRQSENLNDKAGVLTALSGSVTPELRDQILGDLNQDIQGGGKSIRFRYYAIEALEPLLPDPAVQQWLSHLAENDPDPKVAARAGQPLSIVPVRVPVRVPGK